MISRLVRQIFPETNDKSAEPMRFFTDYGDARISSFLESRAQARATFSGIAPK